MTNARSTIDWNGIVEKDIEKFKQYLKCEYEKKGWHAAISEHEIIGVIDEEFNELKLAVHDNNKEHAINELFDIVIAAMWGINSLERNRE